MFEHDNTRLDADPCGRDFVAYMQHRKFERKTTGPSYPIRPDHSPSKCQGCSKAADAALDEFDANHGIDENTTRISEEMRWKRFRVLLAARCDPFKKEIAEWEIEKRRIYEAWRDARK